MKFHIIMAMFNEEPCIKENIRIIQEQTFKNFQCILIDDTSKDNTVAIAREAIDNDQRFKLIANQTQKHKTRNVVEGIQTASPEDEDVVAIVDGDDRLAHENVFSIINDIYKKQDCWMTYGSYCDINGKRDTICRPYSSSIIKKNIYRKKKWLASHLKTFKYKLWKKVDPDVFFITEKEYKNTLIRTLLKGHLRTFLKWRKIKRLDLLDASGKFIRRCDDKAFSYPMLEISGKRAVFIEDILYIYCIKQSMVCKPDPVYGQGKNEKWHTRFIRDVIVHKKKYCRLTHL